jgi:predicted phage tail protein
MALNSKTNLKLIDAICEGPIEGFVHHRKSVFLNETEVTFDQIQQQAVFVARTDGTQDQSEFRRRTVFSDAQTTIEPVGLQIGENYSETVTDENLVKKNGRDYGAGQVIRDITDSEVDFVKLIFTIPKLFCVAAEGLARGQLFFAQIKLAVEIQDQSGAFKQIPIASINTDQENVIKGISTSEYQYETQEIDLRGYRFPYRIRVRKLEFDNAEDAFEIKFTDLEDLPERTPLASKRGDTIIWSSMVLGKRVKVSYPHTALAYLSIDSEEYNTLPSRAYDVRGLKVKLPSNYSEVRADGSLAFKTDDIPFDGSLTTDLHWTTCPVCCFYDMLTNSRYGAGDFIDQSNLNWVDLIDIARYCNELVSTPEGQEPRFAINTVIGSQAEAYNVLQDMASVFRGMLFWKADNVQIAADHGELGNENVPAIHVFSNSNVVGGGFAYSGSSLKTRSTRIRVRYNDPDNFYKPNFIIIEDQALIEKYGIQEKSVVAFGCTSKYQAQRMGRWIMQSEKLHDETITFSVGLEGLNVLPGQVFEVSDEMRLTTRLAGRVVGATRDFVDLDQAAVLPSGSNNKLSVVMADGTVETRAIASVSGIRVTLSTSFTQPPPDDALFAIKNDSVVLSKYRCLSVAEGEAGVYGIVGVKHVDGIYRIVEEPDRNLALPPTFAYGDKPDAPQNPTITFQQVDDGRNTTNRATVSWTRGLAGTTAEFKVRYKIGDGGNYTTVFTTNNSIDITSNLVPNKRLYVEVKAIGPEPDRKQSDYAFVNRVIGVGGTSDDADGQAVVVLPPDPEDVTIELIGSDQVVLRWAPTASGQKIESFVAQIRHNAKTDGSGTWPNSVLMAKVEARTTAVTLPLLNGEYLVKFVNDQQQRSANAGSAVINVPDAIPKYDYEVYREDASPGEFPGQKTNVVYSSEYDGLIFDGDASFDDIASLDGFTDNIDSLFGTQFSSGEYIFQKVVDLGAKYNVRFNRILSTRGLYKSDLIDDRTELIDLWSDFDGEIPDDTNVEMYFRKSDAGATESDLIKEDTDELQLEDGSSIRQESDLTFEEWIPLENNAYVGRSFQFKAVLKTDHIDQTPLVDQLGVSVQLERRTENSGIIQSGSGTKTVTFEKPFYVDADTAVSVGITALGMEAGDYFELDEPTATGFGIRFKATRGDERFVERRFSYTAVGYGTQQA